MSFKNYETSYNDDTTTLETLDEDTIESNCLNNLVICFTGYEAGELSVYEEQIHLMGGKHSPHLTNEVTHLISRNTISDKYKFAVNLNIPIVQDKWLKECWSRRLEVGFNGRKIATKYILPPFVNVQICVSGIPGDERENIENNTRMNGGQYSADLTHYCTHLIIEKPVGKKYKYAKKWGIYLVNQRWFFDCIKRQARVDERDYLLERDDKDNMIKYEQDEENDKSENYYDTDETYDMNDNEEDENFEFLMYEEEKRATLENKEINYNYLERCIIYLGSGFEPDKLVLLKRCILYGGGTRFSDFNSKVTHFVVKSKKSINKSDKNILYSTPNQCIVVNYQWLQRCFIERKLCSVDEYKIERPHEILSINSQIIYDEEGEEEEEEEENKGKIKIRQNNKLSSVKYDVNHIYNELYEESNNNNKNNGFIENSSKMDRRRKNSQINPNKVLDMESSRYENQQNKTKELESKLIQPISKLFDGLNFVSKGFTPEHEQIIENEVLKHSGQYFHSEISIKNNYYQVLPFLNTLNVIVSQKAIIVTEHWLERCLTDEILHNPDENPIFIPCTLEMPIEEFKEIVIGITGFNGIERAHIGKLISKLGAIFSDTLTRKHNFLICDPENMNNSLKYKKALEWNIPVLNINWIYDCFRQERKLPYEKYILGNKANSNSKSEREAQLIKENDLLSNLSTILNNDHITKEPDEMQIDPQNNEQPENIMETEDIKENELEKEKTPEVEIKPEPEPQKEENPELLKGVVISISQRLSHRKNELWELATKMGAECMVKYDDTCTHYIHSGVRAKESFKDFKLAYAKKKFIVSPVWLQKCYELQQHVPEIDYPHTYNPNKQLMMKTTENNQNRANSMMNLNHPNNNNKISHENENEKAKAPAGLEFNRSHSSANLNSFFENYVNASKSSHNVTPAKEVKDQNLDNNNKEGKKETNTMNIEPMESDLSQKGDAPFSDRNDETDNEKAEGYVSAMDNIIKMTSMRRRPRSIRRDASNSNSNDKSKGNNEATTTATTATGEIEDNGKKLDLENPKRKFVEENEDENEEGFVKIDDPEARLEKLKLLDKVNQNKKRIKTLSPNSITSPITMSTTTTPSETENPQPNILSEETTSTTANATEPPQPQPVNSLNEQPTEPGKQNPIVETTNDITIHPKDNQINSDPMEVDPQNHPQNNDNTKSPLNTEKSILINNDKVRIKKDTTPKNKNVEVYDESFVINRTNLRHRRTHNTMCFMFSIIRNELRSVYAKKIKALGGKVSEKDHWDESCTHLIIKEPNRGEKYLAAIASGVWVLKPEYMEESIKQGKFVNEEDYEWGNGPDDTNIAKAAPRWRLQLENYLKPTVEKTRGSFEGWNILLMVDPKKREGFTRLLKAGKGKVTLLKNTIRNIKNKEYTHFFIDGTTRNRLKDLSSISYLMERNILCYDAQYIAEYLISPNPQSSRFEIKINN